MLNIISFTFSVDKIESQIAVFFNIKDRRRYFIQSKKGPKPLLVLKFKEGFKVRYVLLGMNRFDLGV